MRKFYLLLFLLGVMSTAWAQKKGSARGVVYDSLAKEPVAGATISVMDRKDSSLVTFTMSDNTGHFEIRNLPLGDFRLLVTHVNYHNSNTLFTVSEERHDIDFGNVGVTDRNKVLDEVVVTSEAPPITMVGDTIQYNAQSFKTVPNANVEQLLKKLPGVKVDKDGTVRAQGEKVSRVLVDGKEFFGNDPKIATRNLPADAVDKVQVYDKQSDQAQLTGFDDGNYEKTINLKLKKDRKKGLFGKVSAGAGTDERYEGRFNVNSFKGARQFSAIGMGNNTNAEGFSFMDILNFTGALNQMRQGGGGGNISISISEDDAAALGLNTNGNSGINTTWAGGINYNNIIGSKLDLQSNYFYNRFNPNIKSHLLRQNIVQGGSTYYNEDGYSDNLNNSHRANFNALFQLDSSSSIRIQPSFGYQQTRKITEKSYATTNDAGEFINSGLSHNELNREGYNFNNNIFFRKKFKHRGRTFSLSLNTSFNHTTGDGTLYALTNYYNSGSIFRKDTINQYNDNKSDLRGYSARATYTEPLWKKTLLEFSAGYSTTRNTSEKTTYDYNQGSGKFDMLNSQLTNNYENEYSFTNAGLRMRKVGKKYNYSLGATWQRAELTGKIISDLKDSIISKHFVNILPNATFRYNFSRFRNLNVYYNASTNQPSAAQLQPVPDNSNPLYVKLGNPDLKQEFTHSLRTNLGLVNPFKNRNFFFNLNGQLTQNKIVNFDSLDLTTGIQKTKPVNVNGVFNVNTSISYSIPLRLVKGGLEVGTSAGIGRTKQFINQLGNTIKTFSAGPFTRITSNPTDRLSMEVGANYTINRTQYSLSSGRNTRYLTQEYSASVEWQLPSNFTLASDFTYLLNSQRAAGFNTNVPLWNASISKQFLKYNRGEIKLAATDLLNRNTGITRTTVQNYIEDKQVNVLRRFFLLSFTYSLTKSGLNTGNGMSIKMR